MAGRSNDNHHDYLNDDNHSRSNNNRSDDNHGGPGGDHDHSCIVGRSHLYNDDGCDNIYNDH